MTDPERSAIRQIEQWAGRVTAPPALSYIVLDHAHPVYGASTEGRDALGRRYLVMSPAILDEMQHRKWGGFQVLAHEAFDPAVLFGVAVYRRQDMPTEWPEGWPG